MARFSIFGLCLLGRLIRFRYYRCSIGSIIADLAFEIARGAHVGPCVFLLLKKSRCDAESAPLHQLTMRSRRPCCCAPYIFVGSASGQVFRNQTPDSIGDRYHDVSFLEYAAQCLPDQRNVIVLHDAPFHAPSSECFFSVPKQCSRCSTCQDAISQ